MLTLNCQAEKQKRSVSGKAGQEPRKPTEAPLPEPAKFLTLFVFDFGSCAITLVRQTGATLLLANSPPNPQDL
jgi:hypothetical protein